jgi:hypothetical protein
MRIEVVTRRMVPPFLLATVPLALVANGWMALVTPTGLSNPRLVLESAEYDVLIALIGFVIAVFWRGDRYFEAISNRLGTTCAVAGAFSLLIWYLLGIPLLAFGFVTALWFNALVFFLFRPMAAFLVTVLVFRAVAARRKESESERDGSAILNGPDPA